MAAAEPLTELGQTMSDRPDSSPSSDIYTVLLILATVLVAGATLFLAMRSNQLFGTFSPL